MSDESVAKPEVTNVSLPEPAGTVAERMTGNKVQANNIIGVVSARREAEADESKEVAMPKFFISADDRVRVEVVVLFNKKSGELLNIALREFNIDFSKLTFLGSSFESFEFSRPTYDELSSYRQKSMMFDRQIGKMLVDPVRLRNFLIVFHLKGWSLRDNEGNPLPLGFNEAGALDASTLKVIDALHPTMFDVVMSKFETEILLQ